MKHHPTRKLTSQPDLDQLRRQAKELLHDFREGLPEALVEINAYDRDPDPAKFALHDAQLVLARGYGFESWPKLKAFVDGTTIKRFSEAVLAGNITLVESMLRTRPEMVQMDTAGNDERRALHYAVLARNPEMVSLLMEHGADARKGVYPHRDATSPLTIAIERGCSEIVSIIQDCEERRYKKGGPGAKSDQDGIGASIPAPSAAALEELRRLIESGDTAEAVALIESNPSLLEARHGNRHTPLHIAAGKLNLDMAEWLLGRGADPNAVSGGLTPIDLAAVAMEQGKGKQAAFEATTRLLLAAGGRLTARSAVALGDAEWLRARHDEGALANQIEDWGGFLTVAVWRDRPAILSMLLDLGLDPDERTRLSWLEEPTFSWGMPLWWCANGGKVEMAEIVLSSGADPNAVVYASGSPMFQAYANRDWEMVDLLTRFGGKVHATTAGLFRQTELARRMLAGEVEALLEAKEVGEQTLAEELLWGGACGGDPKIVSMALDRVDWAREDHRWYRILEQPLRMWRYGANEDLDRESHLTCFGLLLKRCDPNIVGRFGLTTLHGVAGSRGHLTPEEQVGFPTMLLDAGARLDVRDDLLRSTPLGWACRWGRVELVNLFLERGADPIEKDAEPWATPRAWAEKKGHNQVLSLLGGP